MKKLFLLILLLFLGISPNTFAENQPLPSETGIVKSIEYNEIENPHSKEENLKQIVTVEVLTGEYKGTRQVIDNMLTGNPAYDIPLSKGDKVVLHVEQNQNEIISDNDVDFYIADIKRDNQVLILALCFSALLILTGKKKGLRSIISILFTIVLIGMMIPLVLSGISPVISAVVTGILSSVVTIYLVGGRNSKSTSAIIGTSISLILAGILSLISIHFAHLTGFAGEETMFLYSAHPDLNFRGILSASIIIAALGALMDTAVSIASTINEINETDNSLTVSQLFKSGMNVGRDIIGTMSNTLILVYLGSSLPLVLLANNIDLNKFFNLNQVATEIISALIGSIAILVCVPVTALTASFLVKKHKKENQNFDFDRFDIN